MKILKTAALVVGAVALVATGIGAVAGAGAFLGVAGSTFAAIGTWASIASGVLGLGMALVARPPSFGGGGNPQRFQTNPQSGVPYCFGRTRMSGLRVYGDTYDGFSIKGKHDILAFVALLSVGGQIEGPLAFAADNEAVSFASNGNATGRFSNYMAQKVATGVPGASALALSFGGAGFPGWTSAHKISGTTHAQWALRFDSDGKLYGAGVPEPAWVGKWVRVYDPRLDSTYPGGSGSCRALDESTYVWSRNGALQALTWTLGRWQNGKRTVGIGAPLSMIRIGDFVEAANVAEANGWYCGGTVWSTEAKWTVLKGMLQSCGAVPTRSAGMIGCRVFAPRVSVATIEAADLLDQLTLPTTKPRRDRINTVRPRYRSEAHDWEIITGSAVSVPDFVTADGGMRSREVDLVYVQAETGQGFDGDAQAGQLAAYEIVNSREAGTIGFVTGPKFLGLRAGDCVTLNVPGEGLDNQKIILTADPVFDPATCKISFAAETETDSKHAFALGRTTTPPPPFTPAVADLEPPQPSAGVWTLATALDEAGVPRLTISASATESDPIWKQVLFEYRRTDDPSWTLATAGDTGTIRVTIAPVDGLTEYEARVAYVSAAGIIGPWRDLGSVTTAANTLQILIADAKATADAKRAVFYQATPPAIGASEENDLWINSAEGNRLYRRLPGTGRLAIGSATITLGGDYLALGWVAADDQRVGAAILAAAGAEAAVDGKVTSFSMESAGDPVPTGEGVGDLLYREYLTPVQVDRWDGSAWVPVATFGANATEATKLGGIQPGATVGAPGGTNVGSTPAVAVEGGALAGSAAANGDGTIKTNRIDTAAIQANAISKRYTALAGTTPGTANSGSTRLTVLTLSINKTQADSNIDWSFVIQAGASGSMYALAQLSKDGVYGYGEAFKRASGGVSGAFGDTFVASGAITGLAAGTHDFKLEILWMGGDAVTATHSTLKLEEVMR